jgi:hypothetical protein
MTPCPPDETLAAFVQRRGTRRELVEQHIDACAPCRALVAHLLALRAEHAGDTRPVAVATIATDDTTTTAGTPPTLASNAMATPQGKVARYVIERELGRGGMGIVLLAHDPQLDRKVAVKLVRKSEDPTARARLVREARAMARLSHPNVVTIHDVGELPDGEVFLAMEVVDGPTLREALLGAGRPSPSEVVALFAQAGRGLAAAHAVGLVHRDFKPENVLVGPDGRVRVTDFGLARAETEPAAAALTGAGLVMGTPAYMAPEQHIGVAATDRADQYAFCVALFEALTGERPHAGTSLQEISAAKLRDQRKPWPTTSVVPASVRAAIDRGLARDPGHRFPSMAELLAILEHVPTVPVATMPIAPMAPIAPPQPAWPHAVRAQPIARPPLPSESSKRLVVTVAAIAAGAVLLGGGSCVVLALRVKPSAARAPTDRPPAGATLTAEDALPTPIPPFEPVVANATIASKLPCPAGTVQRSLATSITCVGATDRDREGPSLTFYPSGQLREQLTFHLDKRHGRSWQFAENGVLEEVSDYASGHRDGLWLLLGPTGRLRSEHRYRNGKEHGVHRLWRTDDGRLIVWERYEDGKSVERRQP